MFRSRIEILLDMIIKSVRLSVENVPAHAFRVEPWVDHGLPKNYIPPPLGVTVLQSVTFKTLKSSSTSSPSQFGPPPSSISNRFTRLHHKIHRTLWDDDMRSIN
ncbi:hypothetical protein TNCV_202491 [Trichonephila clavipes]|nr:hypothetical protein TNCV_202491 [Trichonephila clavipes]